MIAIRTTNLAVATTHAPPGWEVKRLDEISDVVRGSSPRPAGDPRFFNGDHLPWITVADVTEGNSPYLTRTESKLTAEGEARTRVLEPGTLMLTNSGATLGVPRICRIRAGANDGIAAFLNLKADALYLYFALGGYTEYFREQLAPGVGQPNLNTDLIGATLVRLPPRKEQTAVARLLRRWDSATQETEQLYRARRKLKRGLLQQLLTGQRRFPEFRKQPWVEVPIGELLREEERYVNWSDDDEYRLVSVRRRSGGFFDRERKRGSDILTKTLKITRTGDFVLARMQVLHGAMTVTPPEFDGAHVSDSYMTLVPRDPAALWMPYFGYLSMTPLLYHKAFTSSFGVAIEKMTFHPRWWLAERVRIPKSVEEQKKIADVLQACDHELALLRQLHDALKEQKRGLMQKLLTGQVRVPASMLKEAARV